MRHVPGVPRTPTLLVSLSMLLSGIESANAELQLASAMVRGGNDIAGTLSMAQSVPVERRIVLVLPMPIPVTGPADIVLPAGATSIGFTLKARPVSVAQSGTITARYLDKAVGSASITVLPAVLSRIALQSPGVEAGQPAKGTVHLDGVAPPGGLEVALTVPAGAPVRVEPDRVVVPSGARSAGFDLVPVRIGVPITAIGANQTGVHQPQATLYVGAIGLAAIELDADTLVGGAAATGHIILDRPAPTGGVVVSLACMSSEPSAKFVATSLSIAAGARKKNFSMTSTAVTSPRVERLSASFNGTTAEAVLLVRPIEVETITLEPDRIAPNRTSTLTIRLERKAPPGGLRVSLGADKLPLGMAPATFSPNVIEISAGNLSGSATVKAGLVRTSATLWAQASKLRRETKLVID